MSNIARYDPLRLVAGSSITTSYTVFGIPLGHAMRIIHLINDTNALIYISFDGIEDHVPLVASQSFALYDLTSDQDNNESFRYQTGTQIYLKYVGSAPTAVTGTSNTVYLISVYGKGE